jgi:hypothetical protein
MSNPLPTLPGVDPPFLDRVDALCARLADHLEARNGRRPTVTVKWRRDMRLLCERGPLGHAAQAVDTAEVALVVEATFDHETWWADRITDPGFLRKHYLRIGREAAAASRKGTASPKAAALIAKLRDL